MMRVRIHLVVIVAALTGLLAITACGSSEKADDTAQGNPAQSTAVANVYFLTSDRFASAAVQRQLAGDVSRPREVLRSLLDGPTQEEANRGIKSALPTNARLLSLRLDRGSAFVDLASLPTNANGPERVRIITQITRSLIGLPEIDRVWLRSGGKPWGLWHMSGGIADVAYDEDDLLGFDRVCAARPGTETVEGDCFSATA